MGHRCGRPTLAGPCLRIIDGTCDLRCAAVVAAIPKPGSRATRTAHPLREIGDWLDDVDIDDGERVWRDPVETLLRRGMLTSVPADLREASKGVVLSQRRIATAKLVLKRGDDPHAVTDDAWQATRMAFASHLTANGLRVSSSAKNHHEVTLRYGKFAITGLDPSFDVDRVDEIRAIRRSVYTLDDIEIHEAASALDVATRAVGLVALDLGG